MPATLVVLALCFAPLSQASVPGTFFWKPRVGLDLAMPAQASKPTKLQHKPTIDNIRNGYAALIDGYQVGMTVAALVAYWGDANDAHPQFQICSAHYYTNAYRWALRHLSLIPDWLSGGSNQHYVSTHKVWRKRFYYMDYFVPKWMRKLFVCVSDESWAKEEWEWSKFVKYAEPNFGKFYRYPSKHFNNYNSMRHPNTVENLDITKASIP
uniref:Uncharacterized protein n=1 Tax=Heliothis virescens TaxID=7102 RepID=A0A2A4JZ53_HELVI